MNLGQLRDTISVLVQNHAPEIDIPVELFIRLTNTASIRHFKRRLGLPERYQPGAPFPPEIAEITRKVSMDLKPFLVHRDNNDSPLSFTNGICPYPEGFCYPLSASHGYTHTDNVTYLRRFDLVTEMEWAELMGSLNKVPTEFFPIMRFTRESLNIAPITIRIVKFIYYKWPREAVMVMKEDNGVNVYDEENSIELEWDESNMIDIAHIILADMGVAASKQDIFAVANQVKQQGI